MMIVLAAALMVLSAFLIAVGVQSQWRLWRSLKADDAIGRIGYASQAQGNRGKIKVSLEGREIEFDCVSSQDFKKHQALKVVDARSNTAVVSGLESRL